MKLYNADAVCRRRTDFGNNSRSLGKIFPIAAGFVSRVDSTPLAHVISLYCGVDGAHFCALQVPRKTRMSGAAAGFDAGQGEFEMRGTYVLGRRGLARAQRVRARRKSRLDAQRSARHHNGAIATLRATGNGGSPTHHRELIPRPVARADESL